MPCMVLSYRNSGALDLKNNSSLFAELQNVKTLKMYYIVDTHVANMLKVCTAPFTVCMVRSGIYRCQAFEIKKIGQCCSSTSWQCAAKRNNNFALSNFNRL